jgi:hypothetical protein
MWDKPTQRRLAAVLAAVLAADFVALSIGP